MTEQDESTLKLLKRIKTDSMISGDSEQLVEYFQKLSSQNYDAFKTHSSDMNDIHKGYALCIDFLLESFANCEKEAVPTEQDQHGANAFS
jgi:hypothetical protein